MKPLCRNLKTYQFVDEGDARGDVQFADLFGADVVEVLHEGPEGVAVRRDEHLLP